MGVSKTLVPGKGLEQGKVGAVRFGDLGYLIQKVARLRVGESSS